MKTFIKSAGGFLVGNINSLLGAGGGMIAVPMLKKQGMEQNKAHANAIALIMILTAASAAIYIFTGKVSVSQAIPYIPAGLAGSIIGSFVMPKIPGNRLRRIFAVFMIWAGVRMIIK